MIVHVYTITKDEEFLMPYFLRHYSTFADRIFVILDKESKDRTREIIEGCGKAEILEYPSNNGLDEFDFSKVYSDYYRLLSRGVADWVICVDTDEFIYHENVLGALSLAKFKGYKVLWCKGYMMISEKLPQTSGQIYEEIKEGIYEKIYNKCAIFNPSEDVIYGKGRHTLSVPIGTGRKDIGLKLLHFRYLSREFIVERTTNNFRSIRGSSQKNRDLMLGRHSPEKMLRFVLGRALEAYSSALKEKRMMI